MTQILQDEVDSCQLYKYCMSRLVTFGCSNTWGDGLPDVCIPEIQRNKNTWPPSKYAWPNVLAKKLNIEVINTAISGKSDKFILQQILDFNFLQNDIVCIMWPPFDRFCFFKEDETVHLGPWWADTEKKNKMFYKHFHSDYDSRLNFFRTTDYVDLYLKKLNKNIMHHQMLFSKFYFSLQPEWCTTKFLETDMVSIKDKHPLGEDKIHPGVDAHIELANIFYTAINSVDKHSS